MFAVIVIVIVTVTVTVVLVVALVAIDGYNSLVKKRNRTKEARSQIDVELERRHDLIPNLVASVKGYAAHESGTLEAVTASRAAAISVGAEPSPAAVRERRERFEQLAALLVRGD
jgi:LemA protein